MYSPPGIQAAGKKKVEMGTRKLALTLSTDCWRKPKGSLHFSISSMSPDDAAFKESSMVSERSLTTFFRCCAGTKSKAKVPEDLDEKGKRQR